MANPSGLLLGGVMMLVHIGQPTVAQTVHNAWLRTIEDGIHTYDIFSEGNSRQKVGTSGFAKAVIERLGKTPEMLPGVTYNSEGKGIAVPTATARPPQKKEMVGVDLFVNWRDGSADDLAGKLAPLNGDDLELVMISNRGVKVWPEGAPETFCTDHWRCRYMANGSGKPVSHQQIAGLMQRAADSGIDFIKTESLCTFDGEPGFSLGQGQ